MLDLAVVGAGAAGIAAATEGHARGLDVLVLEASDRIGGRACTAHLRGHALDLGATWLHSARRNPLVGEAERLGVAIDRSPTRWREQYRQLGFSKEEQAQSGASTEAFIDRLRSDPPPSDRASDALKPGGRWNGTIDALSGYLNGAGLAQVSAADFLAYWDSSENENWRLPGGIGSLFSELGGQLQARTGFTVRQVECSGTKVRLVSDRGAVEAKHAIVTVPTSILGSGQIVFFPDADDWLHAASQLPLGHVEKLFLELAEPHRFPEGAHLIGDPHHADTGSYLFRPLGMPVIEAFFGGDWLKGLTADDLAAKGRDELGRLLGSDFARTLQPIAHSDWQRHRFICGSYSYARPQQHGARSRLAKPVNERLAFAGEACSEVDYATVHGAWASGRAAVAHLFGEAGK